MRANELIRYIQKKPGPVNSIHALRFINSVRPPVNTARVICKFRGSDMIQHSSCVGVASCRFSQEFLDGIILIAFRYNRIQFAYFCAQVLSLKLYFRKFGIPLFPPFQEFLLAVRRPGNGFKNFYFFWNALQPGHPIPLFFSRPYQGFIRLRFLKTANRGQNPCASLKNHGKLK